MKKILVIANSFGVDATRYLYGVARSEKEDIKVVTLHIGSCTLYRHYRNMLSDERAYVYYIDGMDSGLKVSLKEALLSDEWDLVTLQEGSCGMARPVDYSPFIEPLAEYVRQCAPLAKLYLHKTWAFAEDSPRLLKTPFTSRDDMIGNKHSCYARAAENIKADGIIPSLDAMCALYDIIGTAAHRDGFHANLGISRYMLACLWFMVIYGKDITNNKFRDFDIEVTEEEVRLALDIAVRVARENGFID